MLEVGRIGFGDEDKIAGIRSLVTVLSEKAIDRLFILAICIFLILTVWLVLTSHFVSPAGMVILLVPGFILSALYSYAKKHFSDLLYYFVLDGLMMLSGLLMLLLPI